jgi:hypothetical protein
MQIHCEDKNFNSEAMELAYSLYDFMKAKFKFTREPKIYFLVDEENSKNILGKTGFYSPEEGSVHIFVTNRHPKDVLRSLAHELLHHIQGCEGMVDPKRGDTEGTKDPNYVLHDKFLKKIEADAFERGNITFREWEAHKKEDSKMNEEKKMPKAKVVAAHKKAKEALKSGAFKQYGDRAEQVAYATMMKQAQGKEESTEEGSQEESLEENKDVTINDALKNSHYYSIEDRAAPKIATMRDEAIYEELLKKFKIKK